MARFILLAVLAGVGSLLGFTGTKPTNPPVVASDNPAEFAITGPYTHENLSIFLLHGPDTLPARNVLTLDEALAQGKAIVHETGTVNTLCVENLSGDSDLMMQNGDIVKGGRQDRVLRVAMILPPKSGPVAVESFCVEQGRWTNRGSESAAKFGSNPGQIAGKELKLAVNVAGQQGEVWKNVTVAQTALTANNGASVTANASPTSLQLATENKELQAKLAAYRGPLANILEGKTGVVGYAIAVNGKVTGAEVYGSSVLMGKAWKKAVDSAALEAFAEKKPAEYALCKKGDVRSFLLDAGGANESGMLAAADKSRTPTLPPIRDGQAANFYASDPATRTATHINESPNLPAFTGRSSATRNVLVTSNGGVVNGPTLTLTGANTYTGATTVTTGTLDVVQTRATTVNAGASNNQLDLDNPVSVSLDAARRATNVASVQAPPVQVNRVTGANGVLVESRDRANPSVIIHRTFIAK